VELLKTTPVSILPKKEVVVIPSIFTPVQGFEKLLQNNILSAPVFDEQTHKYVGFLDIRDLVSYAVFAFSNHDTVAYTPPTTMPIYTSIVDNVTVSYLARRNNFHPVPLSATLYDVALVLATQVHRVPIIDEKGELVSIISQSTFIQLFKQHLNGTLKEETSVKLKDTSIGTSPPISVSKDTSTIESLKKLDDTKKNGLPIVDEFGHLMGNISGRDLKLFIESSCSYDILKLPINTFLSQIRSEEIDIRAPSISCNINESLSTVIAKLAATHVHRIYVVNSSSDYTPVRVISLTDILKFILHT